MEHKEYKHYMFEYLNDSLTPQESKEFEAWLADKPEQQKALEQMKQMLNISSNWGEEEPPASIRMDFEEAINQEKAKQSKSRGLLESIEEFVQQLQGYKGIRQLVSYAMVMIISGFIGFHLNNRNSGNADLPELSQKLEDMQLTVARLQLKSFSSADRIKGVSNIVTSGVSTPEILSDLSYRLMNDESLHVRMAVAETLSAYADNPEVKMALYEGARKETELIAKIEMIKILIKVDVDLAKEVADEAINSTVMQPNTERLITDLFNSKSL